MDVTGRKEEHERQLREDSTYSGSHWCEVQGMGVDPTGAQGARLLHPLYSTDPQTA